MSRTAKPSIGSSLTQQRLTNLAPAALLLAEVLILSYRFDGQALVDRGPWWGRYAAYARYAPQAAMVVAAALALFGGPRLFAVSAVDGRRSRSLSLSFLAAHLAAFAGLTALTAAVFEGPAGRSPQAALWLLAWALTGVASLGLLLAAAWPVETFVAVARRSAGPLAGAAALGAAACLAGRFTATGWTSLTDATLRLVGLMLGLIFPEVACDPAKWIVGTPGFLVEVAPECSGFEGIGLIWVFLLAYLYVFRGELRFPSALWLLPIGTVVMWLANAVRITLLIVVGSTLSPEVALGGFHSQAGWLAFTAVAFGLVAASRKVGLFAAESAETPGRVEPVMSPTAAYLAPLMALTGAVMVTTAMSRGDGLDLLYPARVVAVLAALFVCRRGYADLRFTGSWTAVGIGVLVFAVWMALEPLAAPAGSSAGFADGLARLSRPAAAAWLAVRAFGSVVTVPIAEELAFRGYLTRRLIAADFTTVAPGRFAWPSFLVSSLLFGLLHGRLLAGVLAGALFALALYRRGRLEDAVLAHAVTNGLIAAYVLATGSWTLWM